MSPSEASSVSTEESAPETNGVTTEVLATVDLGPELEGMAGRRLRARERGLLVLRQCAFDILRMRGDGRCELGTVEQWRGWYARPRTATSGERHRRAA